MPELGNSALAWWWSSDLGHAAVHEEPDTGDEAGGVIGEEDRGLAHLAWVGDPARWVAFAHDLDGGLDLAGSLCHRQ